MFRNFTKVRKAEFYKALGDNKYTSTGWHDPGDGSMMSHRQVIVQGDRTVGYIVTSSWNPDTHYYLKTDSKEFNSLDTELIHERNRRAKSLFDLYSKRKDEEMREFYKNNATIVKKSGGVGLLEPLERSSLMPYTPNPDILDIFKQVV